MRCLLVGNYGVGNLGDEALKEYFLTHFPEVEWTVLSAHPQTARERSRLPGGFRSLLSFRWIRTIGAYCYSDAVVFGGGSLFTDSESPYACFLWWIHASVAHVLRKPIHLAFQGIGPLNSKRGERLARQVCRWAASISVRDAESKKLVDHWQLPVPVIQSFDPVFSMLHGDNHTEVTQKILTVIPRKNSDATFLKVVRDAQAQAIYNSVVVLCLQGDDPVERSVAAVLAEKLEATVRSVTTVQELVEVVFPSAFVVSQRYHGALAALALGVPFSVLPQADGDKLAALASMDGAAVPELLSLVAAGEEYLRQSLQNTARRR